MNTQRPLTSYAMLFFIVLLGGAAAWFFSNIFIYFCLSVVLRTLLKPTVRALRHLRFFGRQLPRALAIVIAFAGAIFLLGALLVLFIPLIKQQTRVLATLDYAELIQYLSIPVDYLEGQLIGWGILSAEKGFLFSLVKEKFFTLLQGIEFRELFKYFVELTGEFVIGTLSVIFITFLLLHEERNLHRSFIQFVPNRYFELVASWLFKIERRFISYLSGLFIQLCIIFVICYAGLFILGIPYAATIALFAALANIIPYLGPLLGATFAIVVTLTSAQGSVFSSTSLWLILEVCIVFACVQLADNWFVQPVVFSKSLQTHPLEIFVIIFVGASLAGVAGMVAAIPMYTILKVSIVDGYRGLSAYHRVHE